MAGRVVYRPLAQGDLDEIYEWVAERADADTALELVRAITKRCEGLLEISSGRPRPEIGPEVLSVPFRRRAVIAYRLDGDDVLIIGIMYGGRDLTMLSRPERLD